MAKNECGIKVPNDVVLKAKKLGSKSCPKYVYRDGDYGNKLPVASVGGQKVTRFRNAKNADAMKIDLGNGWVVFKSPTAANQNTSGYVPRSEGKGKCEPCIICGEDRFTEGAHFPTAKRMGGTDMIPLCPTHHKLLDNGRLSLSELKKIWKNRYSKFETFPEFMKWANSNNYPYSIEDIRNKKVWKDYEEKKVCYKVSNSREWWCKFKGKFHNFKDR